MLISNLDFQRIEPPMKLVLVLILTMEESQRIEPPRTPMVTDISTGRMVLYTHPQSWKKCLKSYSKFVIQGRMPGQYSFGLNWFIFVFLFPYNVDKSSP